MDIAIKSGRDREWKKVSGGDQQAYSSTSDLIHRIPDIIPIEELGTGGSRLKLCIRSNIGSEAQESIIGIDDSGRITIVECDLTNVMGRAMRSALRLWEMPYEEFDGLVSDGEGRSLIELMRERVPADGWSEEEFKNAITSTLQQGDFRLVIAVKELTDEVKRKIKFLSARNFEAYAVEMQHFTDGESEVVIPRIVVGTREEWETLTMPDWGTTFPQASASTVAESEQPAGTPGLAEDITSEQEEPTEVSNSIQPIVAQPKRVPRHNQEKENLFLAKCQENVSGNAVELIRRLYTFSKESADDIMWWGAGGAGAFNFILINRDIDLTVFIVDANGKIMFNFSEWEREPTYKDLLSPFLEKLKSVTILSERERDSTKWPDFNVEKFFATEDDFSAFEESINFLKQKLNSLRIG